MKRILSLLLTLALLAALTGCGLKGKGDPEAIAILNGTSTTKYALSNGTTLEPQVVYDSGGIIVAVAGITGTPQAPELVLAVENGSRREVDLSVNGAVLDGWGVQAWADLWDLSRRSVSLGTVECWDSDWSPRTDIGVIELTMTLQESDGDYDVIDEIDCTLETSAAGHMDAYEPEGVVLYDDKGIRMVMTDLATTRYGETQACLYVENSSGYDIDVEIGEAEVNGWDVEFWTWETIWSGTRTMISAPVYDEDYEYFELEEEDELTFELTVSDSSTYHEIARVNAAVTPADFR